MFIANIRIQGFRCFKELEVDFHSGINIIIGENNAGKSSLLKALGLIFQRNSPRPGRYDFNQEPSNMEAPPSITITATIQSSEADSPDDKATVFAWLTKLDPPWQATLTYKFFLPEEDLNLFKSKCPTPTQDLYWSTVDELLPRYVARIYGGELASKIRADPDTLSSFDYQFLDATRDVEERMASGKSSALRAVVSHAIDADLLEHSVTEKEVIANERRARFREKSTALIDEFKHRINIERFLEMASLTGAIGGGHPTIDGQFGEADLLSTLRLMVTGSSSSKPLPITHNGLGYNNLLFMSLVLSQIERESSKSSLGSNAKCFPMLVIEEPEAHLHPNLQYRLINYIKKRIKTSTNNSTASRQIFITTHSTHITAAGGLDTLICMTAPDDKTGVRISYPSRAFDKTTDSQNSKKYVERYLDATRSEMLFAKAVIFVEGVAEQLLLPILAERIGHSLTDQLVSVVAVGGSTFKHFLPLFGFGPNKESYTYALQNRRVACIVDGDPAYHDPSTAPKRWHSCFPYQLGDNPTYSYRPISTVVTNLQEATKDSHNIAIFHSEKTLEYDLAAQTAAPILITSQCAHSEELKKFASAPTTPSLKLEKAIDTIVNATLTKLEAQGKLPANARFATYYVHCVGSEKGAHALELAQALRIDSTQTPTQTDNVAIPDYIKHAVEWVCNKTPEKNESATSPHPQAA